MLIDGERWCDAADGKTIEATSPATGESLGLVAEGAREDARRAIAAANAALPAWSARTGFERAGLIHRVADACERRSDELARICTLDQGKPLKAEAQVEVGELIDFFRMAAEDAKRLEGRIPESAAPGRLVLLLRRPVGVLGLITPWNWPYTMPAEVLAPALACGCPVVWTPASSTAVCSGVLAECVAEADIPPGAFNFVLGPGSEIGDELAVNPGTHAVGFTGSTEAGSGSPGRRPGRFSFSRWAATVRSWSWTTPTSTRPPRPPRSAAFSAPGRAARPPSGCSCTSGARGLRRPARGAGQAGRSPGRPAGGSDHAGTAQQRAGRREDDEHVADAVERGAEVVAGGARAEGFPTRLYWPATVLDRVPADSIAATQETFGPIAPVVSVGSLEEAIEQTNSQSFGLMAAIFTADLAAGMRFADSVHMGLVNINETTNYWETHLPWGGGGRSDSGIGRVGGRYPMDTLTELQTVLVRT